MRGLGVPARDPQSGQGRADGRRDRPLLGTGARRRDDAGAAPVEPAAARAHADRDRAAAPPPGDDRARRARSSARRPPHRSADGVAVVCRRPARRGLAGRRRDPRRPRARPAGRRARSRRAVGVRHRARPGLREHDPPPDVARRTRPDAPVPRLARRALERVDRRSGDALGRRSCAAAPAPSASGLRPRPGPRRPRGVRGAADAGASSMSSGCSPTAPPTARSPTRS